VIFVLLFSRFTRYNIYRFFILRLITFKCKEPGKEENYVRKNNIELSMEGIASIDFGGKK